MLPAAELKDCKPKPTTSVVASDDDTDLDKLVSQLVEHAINSALKSLHAELTADVTVLSKVTETDGRFEDPKNIAVSFKFDASVLCNQDRVWISVETKKCHVCPPVF